MMKRFVILSLMVAALLACDEDDTDQPNGMTFDWDFSQNANAWTGDFADYPVGEADSYGLTFEQEMLPPPLDETEPAVKLSGTNMSDDLFMFMKTKLTDLQPNTSYNAMFTVEFASNVPDNQVGVGGSPGESVWIKAGAVPVEPIPQEDDMDYYRMNIDKGGQSQGGSDMVVLGDFSNDTDQEEYTLKTVSNESPLVVTSSSEGELWVIIGTDSGFEATTTIYYNTVEVSLEEM